VSSKSDSSPEPARERTKVDPHFPGDLDDGCPLPSPRDGIRQQLFQQALRVRAPSTSRTQRRQFYSQLFSHVVHAESFSTESHLNTTGLSWLSEVLPFGEALHVLDEGATPGALGPADAGDAATASQ